MTDFAQIQLPTLKTLPRKNDTYDFGPPVDFVSKVGADTKNIFPTISLLTGADHSKILKDLDPNYNIHEKSKSLFEFGLATGELGQEIQAALDSILEVKEGGDRGYATIALQREKGRLPKLVEESPEALNYLMRGKFDQKNPLLQNMYIAKTAKEYQRQKLNTNASIIDNLEVVKTNPYFPTIKKDLMDVNMVLPNVPTDDSKIEETLTTKPEQMYTKITGPVGPGLTATTEFENIFPGASKPIPPPRVNHLSILKQEPIINKPKSMPKPQKNINQPLKPDLLDTLSREVNTIPVEDDVINSTIPTSEQLDDDIEINELRNEINESINAIPKPEDVSGSDISSQILEYNTFIETSDINSKNKFLENCEDLINNYGISSDDIISNSMFMEFLISDWGHRIMEDAQIKVRVSDGAIFIGNEKDTHENMYSFLIQQLDFDMLTIEQSFIYNSDISGFGDYLSVLDSQQHSDDRFDLSSNKHIKYLVSRYNSFQNTTNAPPLLLKHTTMKKNSINLKTLLDNEKTEAVANLLTNYSRTANSVIPMALNPVAALTYPTFSKLAQNYNEVSLDFSGNILRPMLTEGNEEIITHLMQNLASNDLTNINSEIRDIVKTTQSTGDLSFIRSIPPEDLSNLIISDWFNIGKTPLASQFIELPASNTIEKSNIVPSTLKTYFEQDITANEQPKINMKSMLNMQAIFAFCKAMIIYLYEKKLISEDEYELGNLYIQNAVNEWHKNLTYGSLIDHQYASTEAAKVLVSYVQQLSINAQVPTELVQPNITDTIEQQAIQSIQENIKNNNQITATMEQQASEDIQQIYRNEIDNIPSDLLSIMNETEIQPAQKQLKEVEFIRNNYFGDINATYDDTKRIVEQNKTNLAIAEAINVDNDPNDSTITGIVSNMISDPMNNYSLNTDDFLNELVSSVKPEFNLQLMPNDTQMNVNQYHHLFTPADSNPSDFHNLIESTEFQVQPIQQQNQLIETEYSPNLTLEYNANNELAEQNLIMAIDPPTINLPIQYTNESDTTNILSVPMEFDFVSEPQLAMELPSSYASNTSIDTLPKINLFNRGGLKDVFDNQEKSSIRFTNRLETQRENRLQFLTRRRQKGEDNTQDLISTKRPKEKAISHPIEQHNMLEQLSIETPIAPEIHSMMNNNKQNPTILSLTMEEPTNLVNLEDQNFITIGNVIGQNNTYDFNKSPLKLISGPITDNINSSEADLLNRTTLKKLYYGSTPSYDLPGQAVLKEMIQLLPISLIKLSKEDRDNAAKLLRNPGHQKTIKKASKTVIKVLGSLIHNFSDIFNKAESDTGLLYRASKRQSLLRSIVSRGWKTGYIQYLINKDLSDSETLPVLYGE